LSYISGTLHHYFFPLVNSFVRQVYWKLPPTIREILCESSKVLTVKLLCEVQSISNTDFWGRL
jgi:hypothetical protein